MRDLSSDTDKLLKHVETEAMRAIRIRLRRERNLKNFGQLCALYCRWAEIDPAHLFDSGADERN